MKKVFTLLFAFMACSWSLLPAANVKVRTLIPTDSEFSTTGTIVFSWKNISGGAWTDVVLTREGTSRWWGATVVIPDETNFTYSIKTETSATTKDVTEIGGWSPTSYIAKDKPELNLEVQALYEEMPNERTFMAGEVPATAEDHDYRISNLQVQDIGNGVTITWDANNLALWTMPIGVTMILLPLPRESLHITMTERMISIWEHLSSTLALMTEHIFSLM